MSDPILRIGRMLIRTAFLASYLCTSHAAEMPAGTYGPVDISLEPLLCATSAGFIGAGDLYLAEVGRSEPILVRRRPEGGVIMSPQMAPLGRGTLVAWLEQGRGRTGNSLLVARAGQEGPSDPTPSVIAEGISATLLRTALGDGVIALVDAATQGEPSLFLSLSRDGGGNFQRTRIPVDTLERLHEVAVALAGDAVLIAVQGEKQDQSFITVIDYPLVGNVPTRIEDVATAAVTPLIEILPLQPTPAVLFKNAEGDHLGLSIATKKGSDWSVAQMPGTEGLDVARLDQLAWPDGRVLIVFSAERPGQQKQRVFASVSDDGGHAWRTAQLDSARFANTRAWLPRAAAAGQIVAVVWEDSRDIRARIRLQYSRDRGATWLPHDVTISDPQYHALRPRIFADAEGVTVAWHQYDTDARQLAYLALRRLTWDRLLALAEEPSLITDDEQSEKTLLHSVNRYWKAMVDRDLKTSYEAHDPFFRAKMPFLQYQVNRGLMVYHSFVVEKAEIFGNEASVKVSVNYSVPHVRIMGDTHSLPARDFLIEETWLRVDGVWTRKYVDALSGGSAIQY